MKAGISVAVFGAGWPSGTLSDRDMVKLFNRSRVNLGLGDMHYSRTLTNLKGRDFEAPSVGRSAYLTAFNSDLVDCFTIGREICCYRGIDEMIEMIRRLLADDGYRSSVAHAGRQRCIAEHTWLDRYRQLLTGLGLLLEGGATDDAVAGPPCER